MMKSLLILHFFVVAIKANGEFTILNIPKSLLFKGNEPIESHDIGEVVYASLGNAISGDSEWSGLHIIDPFNLPQTAVVVTLNGVNHSNVSLAGKTYSIVGDMAEESLNGVTVQLEADSEPVCVISFKHFEDGKLSFRNAFGDVRIPSVANTRYLNGNLHVADKDYLESIALVNAVADNLVNMEKTKFIYISLFIDAVAKSHGDNSDAINEALDLFTTAVKHLNKAAQKLRKNQVLFVVAVNKAGDINRSKRDTVPSDKDQYNLAEYYSEDYPVVFNIILWFMVVFGLALLAICYAIGTMDPGRDSIIYRMTSTRMKKDN